MEIIIAIAVLGIALWWFFLRTPADTTPATIYKAETPTPPQVIESTVELAPAVVAATVVVAETVVESAPVVEVAPVVEAPVKKPRKPRTPKAVV
jgi:hypothetical protein